MAPLLYTATARFDPSPGAKERFPAGAKLMLVMQVVGGAPREFVSGFAASADAAVSFDGKRVLFAGRQKPGDPWRIYEIPLAGGNPRPVTSGSEDCVRPFYLPEDKVVYSRRSSLGYELEVAPLAGGAPLRITYSAGDHFATGVLRDGRILFEAPHAASAGRELYTIYGDGSGVESVRCDHGKDRRSGTQLASGDILLLSGSGLARFTSPRAVEVPVAAPKGEYATPAVELDSGELLISFRPSPAAPFSVALLKAGQVAGLPQTVFANAVQPVTVLPHAVPLRHPSSLGDRTGSNLLCLNAYTSRDRAIPTGLIHAVRVFAQDDAGRSVKLGEAPVEKDGSFYLTVPSERPLRFELLDNSSNVVRAQKGWFSTRRGEQRVCVGCHAGPERAPDNASPAILGRSTDPVKLAMPEGGMK